MQRVGISRCVVNGTSPDDWNEVAQLANDFPTFVTPSFGLHPWKAIEPGWEEKLEAFLLKFPQAGVGECGLDRWMRGYEMDLQSLVFTAHIRLAVKYDRVLSIHCLRAWGRLLELLKSAPLPKRGFLLHSYAGPAELVDDFVQLGAYFSFSGYFLQPRKQTVRDTFMHLPKDRILLETDSPDMFLPEELDAYPEFRRKKINHPGNLKVIYQQASELLDAAQVEKNFTRLWG